MEKNSKESNKRLERVHAICQILADVYADEQQHERAMIFRRAVASDRPLERLPGWAYKQTVKLLQELQYDVEHTGE